MSLPAGSAELIAVSSLFTYDIFRTYISPNASPATTIKVSRVCVFVFGCLMGILAVLLNVANVSLGWVYLAMVCALTSLGFIHQYPCAATPLRRGVSSQRVPLRCCGSSLLAAPPRWRNGCDFLNHQHPPP